MRATGHEPPAGAGEPESGLAEMRAAQQPSDTHSSDTVSEASEGSFPASDAPPWTTGATRSAPEPDTSTHGDAVTQASEQSFPASDAPPWTSSAT
ncbi:MAG TPA: hypothetical protein VFQ25_05705 [Ktedonobacterales bacterium]|nr:hypothetical protein [Ktedonobacterales bacterium]